MNILALIILSNILISLIAFIGIFFLAFNKEQLDKLVLGLIAFSAGALMSAAFIHLLPEAIIQSHDANTACVYTFLGFIIFFLIEKILYWRHCHHENCQTHPFGYLNLIGDAIHNFTDGFIIAASYSVSISLGIVTCIAIAAHEIPQEIGDFGVLIYAGFNIKKALWLNFIVALTAIVGGIAGYLLLEQIHHIAPILLSLAAGGFIYISSSDLIPELRKSVKIKESLVISFLFILGTLIMWLTKIIFGN